MSIYNGREDDKYAINMLYITTVRVKIHNVTKYKEMYNIIN